MTIQQLNGLWNFRIGKGEWTDVNVPYSCLSVGHSECSRYFDLTEQRKKVFLKFNGITYYAKVYLNDTYLGDMGPYCEYTFDITNKVKDKNNYLLVEIEDISPVFGPSEGWENFGGIIRDVFIEYASDNYIEDVFFYTNLSSDYNDAMFTVETKTCNTTGNIQIGLFYKGKEIFSTKYPAAKNKFEGTVENIKLWSPENPNLYQLRVLLIDDDNIIDEYTCNVGFREFKCNRHRFVLNGKELFLKGVCKHEMFGDSGHCPTDEQMLADLQMIKDTGCNFVRLVHYPHNKKIIDFADKLGLMVSEEPGLWWSDTSDPQISSGSLEVLRRTILRDKNHPSIMFWLCFNECVFTEQFLIDSANVCRELDPTRMVSGANCMSNEDTLKYYNICNFDFYTMHPYSQTFDRAMESAKILYDKPLLFTEWGGHFVYDNPKLLSEFMDNMYNLYSTNSDSGTLAGAFFWEWSELNDYNRGAPACIDGNLCEGLVNKYRHPNLIYDSFVKGIKRMGSASEYDFWFNPTKCRASDAKNICTGDNTNDKLHDVIARINQEEADKRAMRKRIIENGPVLKNIGTLLNVPIVLGDNDRLNFDCDIQTNKITITGMVSLEKGYPISGEYGEEVAEMILFFENGTVQSYIFRNGIDVTTVFELYKSSKINPVAENARRFATFGYDKNFERYVMNQIELPLNTHNQISKLNICSKNNGYTLLIYSISL